MPGFEKVIRVRGEAGGIGKGEALAYARRLHILG